MSDVTAAPASAASAASAIKLPGLGEIGAFMKRGDIALAVGVLTILVVLILPLPPLLLDFALAISIIFSVLILMTALFIREPLELGSTEPLPKRLLLPTDLRDWIVDLEQRGRHPKAGLSSKTICREASSLPRRGT